MDRNADNVRTGCFVRAISRASLPILDKSDSVPVRRARCTGTFSGRRVMSLMAAPPRFPRLRPAGHERPPGPRSQACRDACAPAPRRKSPKCARLGGELPHPRRCKAARRAPARCPDSKTPPGYIFRVIIFCLLCRHVYGIHGISSFMGFVTGYEEQAG